jgi:hypothetical protein
MTNIIIGPKGGIYYIKNERKIYISSKLNFGKKKLQIKTIRTDKKLWKKIVSDVKKGSKGGKPSQWSARKAQLAVHVYKKKGGKYRSKRSNNNLKKWTNQNWRTKSGKPSVVGKNATGERYLPSKVIKKLSKKEYEKTTREKRKSIKEKKQYSKQPNRIAKKTSKWRNYNFSTV